MKEMVLDIEVVIKTHRTIETQEIPGTDFVYYEDINEIYKNGEKHTEIKKGFTSKDNILSISELKPISWKVNAPKMYDKIATVAAIRKSEFRKVLNGEKHITEVIETTDNVSYPVPDDYILVLWNLASHKIADLNYNFIPIPIQFGYISGNVDNENYDLTKLLEKLKNDEHVINRKDLKISDIPYYNCNDVSTKSIEFLYLLGREDYEKVCQMDSFSNTYYILRQIIGVDDCMIK